MSTLRLSSFLLLFLVLAASPEGEDKELWDLAKQELVQRTQEYVRRNPISEELRSFIENLKRPKRRKRQEHNNMYAIRDGDIVPLAALEDEVNNSENLSDNFTVVPLIVPIRLVANTERSKEKVPSATSDFEESSQRAILGRGQALLKAKDKHSTPEDSTDETVVDSLIEDKLKSTESSELNKVLEDVQNLISVQKRGKGGGKEGALCNVLGYWDSESGGMTFRIRRVEDKVRVTMAPKEPPTEDGFLAQEKWNVSGTIPFAQSAQVVITLTAHKGRRVAMFLGECRVCEGTETITGDWLVGKTSSGCKDQKASHLFVADVLQKNNVETLRQAHLHAMATVETNETTEESR